MYVSHSSLLQKPIFTIDWATSIFFSLTQLCFIFLLSFARLAKTWLLRRLIMQLWSHTWTMILISQWLVFHRDPLQVTHRYLWKIVSVWNPASSQLSETNPELKTRRLVHLYSQYEILSRVKWLLWGFLQKLFFLQKQKTPLKIGHSIKITTKQQQNPPTQYFSVLSTSPNT